MTEFFATITNDLEALEKFMNDFEELEELTPKEQFNCNLVFDEMITNIIKYGYRDQHKHEIHIEVRMNKEQIAIVISDDGIDFNPLDIAEPDIDIDLDEREIGGLGIHLVRQISSDVFHRFENGMNINEIVLEREE